MASDVTNTLLNFRDFLDRNLSRVRDAVGDDLTEDWVQANWELLVESQLCEPGSEFLEIYGEGADCNEGSSRVWNPRVTVTCHVSITLKTAAIDGFSGSPIPEATGQTANLAFEKFVSWDGKVYSEEAPLNYLIASCADQEYLLEVEQVKFKLTVSAQESTL